MVTFLCAMAWALTGLLSIMKSNKKPNFLKKRDDKKQKEDFEASNFFDEAWEQYDYDEDDDYFEEEEGGNLLRNLCLVIAIILSIMVCLFFGEVIIKDYIITQKLALYEEENLKIEKNMSKLVNTYVKCADEIYAGIEKLNPIGAVSILPELHSDTWVKSQVSAYAENKQKIQVLRAEEIELATQRWNLYFGR